jgi:ATP-dependent helicase Lhr and Lhr-like helicase
MTGSTMSDTLLDVDDLYEQHQNIRQLLPNAYNAFFAQFGRLRPVQLGAIPPILAGRNVLVTAPTAGGKTEAVGAPICEKIVARSWAGLSALLITPTRALVRRRQ